MKNKEKNKKTKKQPSLKRVILFALALILFLVVTNPTLLPFLSEDVKQSIGNVWESLFGDVGGIVGILSVNWAALFKLIAMVLLLCLVAALVRFLLARLKPQSGRGKSAVSMLSSASNYIVVIGGIFWGLSILGVSLSTIFAGIGVLALVIGFGAESLVADIVTGVFLVFEEQFNVGDIIEVGGFRGTVESIGIRTTAISDPGKNVKIINNSDIRNVLNRSKATSIASTRVGIGYGESIERVEEKLGELLPEIKEKYPEVFLTAPKYVGVDALGESSVELKIIAEVDEENIFSAPRILNREIKLAFDKAGIEIPYQQIVVHKAD